MSLRSSSCFSLSSPCPVARGRTPQGHRTSSVRSRIVVAGHRPRAQSGGTQGQRPSRTVEVPREKSLALFFCAVNEANDGGMRMADRLRTQIEQTRRFLSHKRVKAAPPSLPQNRIAAAEPPLETRFGLRGRRPRSDAVGLRRLGQAQVRVDRPRRLRNPRARFIHVVGANVRARSDW